MAQCPGCGLLVEGGLNLVVGIVRLTTYRCKCHRAWRVTTLTIPFAVHELIRELDRLQKKWSAFTPPHIKLTMAYLSTKIEDHRRSAMDEESRLRKRRADHWERKFLNDAIGEDYAEKRSGRERRTE